MRNLVVALILVSLTTILAVPSPPLRRGKKPLIDAREITKAKNITDTRIINGQQASRGQFPYQVTVTFTDSEGSWFCGGALISNQWVLTAAHCAVGGISFTIVLGATTLNGNQDGRITLSVEAFFVHPNWDDQDLHNDIALLKLERAVDFNNNIQPLDLPADDEYIDEDVTLTVSGFGLTSDTSDLSNNLLYVQVRSISQSNCNNYYGGGVWEGQICTLGIPNGATCEGDSGGPLVREVDGRRISVGIVSFGAAAGCAAGFPDGYSRTSYYRQWIREVSGL